MESATWTRWRGRRSHGTEPKTYLLRTLLLRKHFLLLCHDLGLVLQAEGQGQSHEQSARRDYPDEVPDQLSARLEEAGGARDARRDFVPGCRRDDVDEGGDALVEGLLAVRLGADGGERHGRRRARGRGRRVRRVVADVLFFDDLDFDHGERAARTAGATVLAVGRNGVQFSRRRASSGSVCQRDVMHQGIASRHHRVTPAGPRMLFSAHLSQFG